MIYILLSVLSATLIIITFKLFHRFKIDTLQAIVINYIVASGVGFLTIAGEFDFASIPSKPWIYMAMIIGLMLILAFYLFGLSAQYAGVTITAISSRMSVVIPVVLGFLVFNDDINILKITGIFIALIAFYLTFKKDTRIDFTSRYYYLPILLLLAVGANHALMKYAEHFYIGEDFILFMATAFLFALILGILVHLLRSTKTGFRFQLKSIAGGIVLGLLNWVASFNFLQSLHFYQISVFVPIYNVCVVVLSTLAGVMLFKERLRPINWVGVIIAIAAIIMLAIA